MILGWETHWERLWEERGRAVCKVLGETVPVGEVVPFSWDSPRLPGACGLCFQPTAERPYYLYMSLGMSQPLDTGDEVPPWELAVFATDQTSWPFRLLHALLTVYVKQPAAISRGLRLPLAFFRSDAGGLGVKLSAHSSGREAATTTAGLILWDDRERLTFRVSSGEFRLLTAITITADEDHLAANNSSPHLLLLLQQMGVGQISDPFRPSVLTMPQAPDAWNRVSHLPEQEVIRQLQS